MKEIRLGLEDNLDVSIYAKTKFNFHQMRKIRKGLRDNLDVSKYTNPKFNADKMEEIRLKLLRESRLT